MSVLAANSAYPSVVLVVEDELLVRWNIASYLRDAGYVVLETDSGEKACALSKSDTSIDIVFTDISLAGATSGWDVAECFRADRPHVSVLYTSGKLIDPQRCVPGSAFFSKPYKSVDVLNACQRLRTE